MNKTGLIKELSVKLDVSEEKASKIESMLEENFIVGKKNKEKTVELFMNELDLSSEEADELYNQSMDVIKDCLVDKIKHPFKDNDK